MNEPAAVRKAESLLQFVRGLGAPLKKFQVAITESEAYELLDHIAVGGLGRCAQHELLLEDIAQAKKAGKPFEVLQHFALCGMSIAPAHVVLH